MKHIDRLNNLGYTIQDHRKLGMGFYVKNSPYLETGAELRYSSTRNFYVLVSSTERTADEILKLAKALLELGNAAKKLNEALKNEQAN